MYMYLFPVFILVNEINRQITTSEIYLLKRDTPLSGEMEIVFYRTVALLKDEDSDEKYVEISRSSESLLEKNLKVLS